ncbi:MAG: hypothetical protein CBD76_02440 [Pelagibacteraceae bacterium TMED216]|nr:MAG: hypothetical protein CBD76_02440 [Pelagibacteraceae bacterium TMED216]
MTERKKKILILQFLLLIVGIVIIYFTYYNKDKTTTESLDKSQNILKEKKDLVSNKETNNNTANIFEDVEYKGIDSAGNRFSIESEKAEFEVDNPNLIKMTKMIAYFFFKDGTALKIVGDYGTYNNILHDMTFRENIIAEYETNYLYANNLDYFNSKRKLNIFGDIRGDNNIGNIMADKLSIDLDKEKLDISMFNEDRIKVKIKD